jgi:hypothetical protein
MMQRIRALVLNMSDLRTMTRQALASAACRALADGVVLLGVRRNVVVGTGKRARTEPLRPTATRFQLDLDQDVVLWIPALLAHQM